MTLLRKTVLTGALLLATALTGCGSTEDATLGASLARDLGGLIKSRRVAAAPAADLGLTPATLASVTTPLQLVTLQRTGAQALIGPLGSNGGVDTWGTTDGQSISYRQGILVATRGIGTDLMSVVAPSLADVARGAGSHNRVHFYTDGLDQTDRQAFTCTLSVAGTETISIVQRGYVTRRVNEDCTGPMGTFQNSYWFDGGTYLRQSRQYVAKEAGWLETKRLRD